MLSIFRNRLTLLRSEHGNVIMMVGLMMLTLIAAVGVAVDMARAQILQQRISAALDAAGLAAAEDVSVLPPGQTDHTAWATQEATRYFYANIPQGYLGSTLSDPVAIPSTDLNTINLSESATQSTVFMKLFGFNSVSVSAASQITRSNNGTGYEIVLALDNTGSMNQPVNAADSGVSKLEAVKSAITGSGGLLDILYGGNDTIANQFIGLVPFTQAVNVGTSNTGWVSSTAGFDWGPGGSWGGCVEARDLTDQTPAQAKFPPYYFQANTPTFTDTGYAAAFAPPSSPTSSTTGYVNFNPWGPTGYPSGNVQYVNPSNRSQMITVSPGTYESPLTAYSANGNPQGPNRFCPQAVQPMVASRDTISTAVGTMVAGGDTNLDVGAAWSWRMLSPNWRGTWTGGDMPANNLPLDYNTPDHKKYVIFMTDGMNHYGNGNYTAYGFLSQGNLGTTDPTVAATNLDTNTKSVCDSMRANGIVVWTIGFGTTDDDDPSNPTSVNGPLLKYCAYDINHYFLAPTNAALAQAFQQIANAIENIRISK